MGREPRTILHVDMDAFFAQVEVLAAPSMRGKPLVIGGYPGHRGVVATASYEARPYGIRSGMPLSEARRLCPEAVFLPCHPKRYLDLSARILKILLERTPSVEMASIDEAFLDASLLVDRFDDGIRVARSIQTDLLARLSLSASVGIGPNKLIAKMASGLHKPGGCTLLDVTAFRNRFASEPVRILYGIGPATAMRLERVGIHRIGQLADSPGPILRRLLGVWGPLLKAAAGGTDTSPVVAYHATPAAKSLGHEYTLPKDEVDRGALRRLLLGLCEEVGTDLRAEGKICGTVHLKIRWDDFSGSSRQVRLAEPSAHTRKLFRTAWALFVQLDLRKPVRLLGVSVSGLLPFGNPETGDLFGGMRLDDLERAADRIRETCGRRRIVRAALLPEGKR